MKRIILKNSGLPMSMLVPDETSVEIEPGDGGERQWLEVIDDRRGLIMRADWVLKAVEAASGEVAIKALLNAALSDDYSYDDQEKTALLNLTGEALRRETAKHLVQVFININTHKE